MLLAVNLWTKTSLANAESGADHLFASGAQANDADLEKEYRYSIQAIQKNILSNGGVIASPSTVAPNYYYEWIRDSSLTISALASLPDSDVPDSVLTGWVIHQLALQVTPKLTDLGEPRFNVNGTANFDPWGRPQNDGPALRALAGMAIAQRWKRQGRMSEINSYLYSPDLPAKTLIKRDLEYVSYHWNEPCFDLWEEEQGFHSYTLTVQRAALEQGAKFATEMNDPNAASFYKKQAAGITSMLKTFIDSQNQTIIYALNKTKSNESKSTSLDVAVLLAANQTFYDGQFHVPMGPLVNTVNALSDAFQKEYAINQVAEDDFSSQGVAFGRYPGDVYSGTAFTTGNPWFLSTLALAEFDCRKNAKLTDLATQQFNLVLRHMNHDSNSYGALSEQFNRDTGIEQGARDLTWSYAAFITAYQACYGIAQ